MYAWFELDEDNCPRLPEKTKVGDEEKKNYNDEVEEFMDKNYKSFEHLVNIIDHNKDKGTQALSFVFGARTVIFPEGSAQKGLEKLDDQYNAKDIQDQKELQLLCDEAKLNQKSLHDFKQDMCELRRKLDVHYKIEKSDKEYMQKLVNSINIKEYDLDKILIRRMQRDGTLTPKIWVEELRQTWVDHFKSDEDNKTKKKHDVNITGKGNLMVGATTVESGDIKSINAELLEVEHIEVTSEQEENWRSYIMSTYTNGRMDWNHREIFEELIYELQNAIYDGVVMPKAGRKLINMTRGWMHEELRIHSSIYWQKNYRYFMTWYKTFEECGHIDILIMESKMKQKKILIS